MQGKQTENKVQKKKAQTSAISDVYVKVPSKELETLQVFFGLTGMKKAFLDALPAYTRKELSQALLGSTRLALLNDIRQFHLQHKGVISEFIDDTAA